MDKVKVKRIIDDLKEYEKWLKTKKDLALSFKEEITANRIEKEIERVEKKIKLLEEMIE